MGSNDGFNGGSESAKDPFAPPPLVAPMYTTCQTSLEYKL